MEFRFKLEQVMWLYASLQVIKIPDESGQYYNVQIELQRFFFKGQKRLSMYVLGKIPIALQRNTEKKIQISQPA